ncbi:MAG: hypothetical protein IPL20_17765 [Saprospiraceae bacterium]|nr:hypothetical protein [Saprospiraceae bacterium]
MGTRPEKRYAECHEFLKPMWEEGKMKVIHNVGYPDPNYSHFRSSDIWATASDEDEYVSSGWIGRYFDYEFPAFQDAQPTIPPAANRGSDRSRFSKQPRKSGPGHQQSE